MVQDRIQIGAERTEAWKSVPATGNEKVVGTFAFPHLDEMTFEESSNLPARPRMYKLPWLPYAYGETRYIVTSLGGGEFVGCTGLKPDGSEEEVFGFPFKLQVCQGEDGEYIKVWGLSGEFAEGVRAEDRPIVLRKVQ